MCVVVKRFVMVLVVLALAAGPAFAGRGNPPARPGARLANATFSCERAAARLARVESRIDRVQARIDAGTAKNAAFAAKLKQMLEKRAARIEARIAAKC